MSNWETYFSLLRCVDCSGQLQREGDFQSPSSQTTLICQSCNRQYPGPKGLPVIFDDTRRCEILTNPEKYQQHLADLESRANAAAGMTADQLGQFKQQGQDDDAMGWEMLFWERWKNQDDGFLQFDPERIEIFLRKDIEGGGRAEFFDEVQSQCKNLAGKGKKLLNIGAGRDFLLERFIAAGYEVVEQDTVLESLELLKTRGADFCVCSDARKLPFADNSFDIVTSFAVLHHIWPIDQPISEMLRVLKPGGLAFFNEPNAYALTRAALFLPKFLKRRLKKIYSGDDTPSPYEQSINPQSFRQIVRNGGGEVRELKFKRTSWISPEATGLKKFLRAINLAVVQLLPMVSSHFSAVVRKKQL